jgi:hypothetical protein
LIWSRNSSLVTPTLEALLPGTRDTPADPSGEARAQSRSAMALLTPGPGPCPARLVKLEFHGPGSRSWSFATSGGEGNPQPQDPRSAPQPFSAEVSPGAGLGPSEKPGTERPGARNPGQTEVFPGLMEIVIAAGGEITCVSSPSAKDHGENRGQTTVLPGLTEIVIAAVAGLDPAPPPAT